MRTFAALTLLVAACSSSPVQSTPPPGPDAGYECNPTEVTPLWCSPTLTCNGKQELCGVTGSVGEERCFRLPAECCADISCACVTAHWKPPVGMVVASCTDQPQVDASNAQPGITLAYSF